MFGTADSWRKQYGIDIERLPSLHEDDLRVNGGTQKLDAARQAGLGALFVQRTGMNLTALWQAMSGGAGRVPVDRVAEKLRVAGAGQLGPRELGLLQRHLIAAADGTVGLQEWLAVFGQNVPRSIDPDARGAGMPSPYVSERTVTELPHMRDDNDMPGGQPVPSGGAAYSWIGGQMDADVTADYEAARHSVASPDAEWRKRGSDMAPFGVVPDRYANQPPGGPKASWGATGTALPHSPTYAKTTGRAGAPFATQVGTSELDHPEPRAEPGPAAPPSQVRSDAPYAWVPYGTTQDNAPPQPVATPISAVRHGSSQVIQTPYASGGAWDRSR